jgi:hypothetical protein
MFRVLMIAALCAAAAAAADPPRPNPKQPVNYVRWINEEFGRGITENAADRYQKAISELWRDDNVEMHAMDDATKWKRAQRQQLKAGVQKNTKCLEDFAAAARMSDCYFALKSDSGAMISVTLPDTSSMRAITKLLATRARLRLLDGDADGATDDVDAVLSASLHMQKQPALIQYLVGISMGQLAYDALLDVPKLASGTRDYEKMISRLRLMYREPEAPLRQLEAERLLAFDMAQRYAKDTDGDGQYEEFHLSKEAREAFGDSEDTYRLGPPLTFEAMTKQIDDFFDQWGSAVAGDFQTARTVEARIEKDLAANPHTLMGLMGPALSRVPDLYYRSLASRHGTETVLELHAYRAKNGKWPATLDEGLSKSIARPRFDPFSGKPFVYWLKNGQPLLYSVGENAVDDHGEVFLSNGRPACGATGDYVFWPR